MTIPAEDLQLGIKDSYGNIGKDGQVLALDKEGNTIWIDYPGGGFAAEEPRGPGDAPVPGALSDSSQREKTGGVILPPMVRQHEGQKILYDMTSWENGWNTCLEFIRRNNPSIAFWVIKDLYLPKYWKK